MIIIKKTVIFIISIIALVFTPFKNKKNLLSSDKTIEKIINNELSLIRLGDGEFRLFFFKKKIYYQNYDENLQIELNQIISNYNEKSKYLLSLPYDFFGNNIFWFMKLKRLKYIFYFAIFRFYFVFFMNKKVFYGDATTFAMKNENNYKKIWENCDVVIFVHNNKIYANEFEKKYNKKVEFIAVKSENSYDDVDKIENDIIELVKKYQSNYKILLSAGPCSKVISYRLCQKNIISYDVGHCWDEPLIVE